MAGVGAPVIFVFQGSRSSQVLVNIRESINTHVIHAGLCRQCWRTAACSAGIHMQADSIRNQRVYPPLRVIIELVVLVDDPAPFAHAEGLMHSDSANIV